MNREAGRRRDADRSAAAAALPARPAPRTLRNQATSFGRLLFFAIIALVPLPFGSHDPSSIAILCLAMALAMPFATAVDMPAPHAVILLVFFAVVAAYFAVLLGQMGIGPFTSPPADVWKEASELLHTQIVADATFVHASAYYAFGRSLACILAFTLGFCVSIDRLGARRLLVVIAWSGAGYAIYGIFSALFEPTMLLWRERDGFVGNVLGTFTNRNTAATYFGSCATIWLLLLCELIKQRMPNGRLKWKHFYREILSTTHLQTSLYFGGFVTCLMATLMTGSRAGTIISLITMIAAPAFYFRKDLPTINRRITGLVGVAVFVLIILQVLGGALNQRFETSGFSDENRFDVYRTTFKMIWDHPLFGVGLGAFPDVFPLYRQIPPSMWGIWTAAHSTPIETMAEVGIPLTLLFGFFFGGALMLMVRAALNRRRDAIIPLIAASTSLIALLHSCIDFSLQVPGFATVAMALFGMGLAQSFRPAASNGSNGDATHSEPAFTSTVANHGARRRERSHRDRDRTSH